MHQTRRKLLASTLAAPLGALADATGRHCPGCIRAADPEATAIGVAEMAAAQAPPPRGVTSVREYLAWWKKVVDETHQLGIKVQATFSITLSVTPKLATGAGSSTIESRGKRVCWDRSLWPSR